MTTTGIRQAAGWIIIGFAAFELCAREVARRSLLEAGSVWIVLAAIAGGLVASGLKRWTAPVLFAVLFTAGVALQLHLGARLQSDGFYYYAYLRSLAFDHDVDFANDYRMLGLGDKAHLFNPTPTGHAQSAWTIGPAIIWSPFFAGGHAIAKRLAAKGAPVSTDGTAYPYRQSVCIAGLFYGLLGAWFTFRLSALFTHRKVAGLATTLTIMGSFMLWYLVKEPSMTHGPSMAGAAGFAWLWAATRERRTTRQWALLGAVAGFVTLIRWQNALFALLPACEALATIVSSVRAGDRGRMRTTLIAGAVFTACATIAFIPQMLAWKAIYGSYLAVSPVGPQIRFWDAHVADVLWSSRNGLFSWSPVLYCGALGLVLLAVRRPAVFVPVIITVGTMVYFNASIQDWWGSDGFGGRRFDGTIPLFALGVAALAETAADLTRRHPLRVVAAAGAMLVVWNLAMMGVAQDGRIRIGEPVSFGETGAQQARVLHRWIGNPFTYPASLLFAFRNDVRIGDYDLLSVNRFLADPLRPYGRIDIGGTEGPLLGDGWHAEERDGLVTFRWAASPAAVLVPLDHAADLLVQVRAQAFNYPNAGPQMVTVWVNDRSVATNLTVPAEWTTIEFPVAADAWRSGVNRLRLEFSRANRPADVGAGGDTRMLAAAVDYVRVQVR